MKFIYVFAISVVFITCQNKEKKFDFAEKMLIASTPNSIMQTLTKQCSTVARPQTRPIAAFYKEFLRSWHYENDEKGRDNIKSIGLITSQSVLSGDCEDQTVYLWSFCRALHSFSIVAVSDDGKKGHIWLEVLAMRDYKRQNQKSIKAIVDDFDAETITLVEHNADLYIALNPHSVIYSFKNCLYIDTTNQSYILPRKIINYNSLTN